jgi:hypothetical protein
MGLTGAGLLLAIVGWAIAQPPRVQARRRSRAAVKLPEAPRR